ncbi:putative membrane protein [Kibdelosporangium banguiense]|uniref:Membrane protein n=1 Tax=Kibdelosporangium banguiense TaxID=1365924 RepID=A0ABS4TIV7_9PSEU|nr:DUF2306 domain-containing protein [Kibdelosporangium banguiense]MBP2324363.1 putative membrane protein [Kibdelosporangium banguiense]
MTKAIARARPRWRVPAALILLSVVPMIGGAMRLADLGGGGPVTADNARFFEAPVPVVLHIFSASVYCVLGALQFAPLRRTWHRNAGRVVVPCGLTLALSGLWMTLFYESPDGVVLAGFRLVFGTAMVLSLVLGFTAIRQRDILRHRAWMIRGYAIGIAAGTQALLHVLWIPFFGTPTGLTSELLIGSGWVINLLVAERAIRSKEIR